MYKDYQLEDYLKVADECICRVREMLQARYGELKELCDAINDRYPFENLFLKQAEVDFEEQLLEELLTCLQKCSPEWVISTTEENYARASLEAEKRANQMLQELLIHQQKCSPERVMPTTKESSVRICGRQKAKMPKQLHCGTVIRQPVELLKRIIKPKKR